MLGAGFFLLSCLIWLLHILTQYFYLRFIWTQYLYTRGFSYILVDFDMCAWPQLCAWYICARDIGCARDIQLLIFFFCFVRPGIMRVRPGHSPVRTIRSKDLLRCILLASILFVRHRLTFLFYCRATKHLRVRTSIRVCEQEYCCASRCLLRCTPLRLLKICILLNISAYFFFFDICARTDTSYVCEQLRVRPAHLCAISVTQLLIFSLIFAHLIFYFHPPGLFGVLCSPPFSWRLFTRMVVPPILVHFTPSTSFRFEYSHVLVPRTWEYYCTMMARHRIFNSNVRKLTFSFHYSAPWCHHLSLGIFDSNVRKLTFSSSLFLGSISPFITVYHIQID